jgi:histidinol phosphatase-like PHP family hydrolase
MCAPGKFGITALQKEDFDIVLLASNHFYLDGVEKPEKFTPSAIASHIRRFFISAAGSGLADILVHPLMPLGFMEVAEDVLDSFSDSELFDIFSVATENGAAIEINGGVLSDWYNRNFSEELLLRIFETAKDAGCLFCCGSDSHSNTSFAPRYYLLENFVTKLGLTDNDWSPWVNGELVEQ